MNEFGIALPPVNPDDKVVKRTLTALVTLADGTVKDPAVTEYQADQGEILMTFEKDATVSLSVVDSDAAGNASAASDPFVFTSVDNIAPAKPGQVGASFKREI